MSTVESAKVKVRNALEKLPNDVLAAGTIEAIIENTPEQILLAIDDIVYQEPTVSLPAYMKTIYTVLGWREVLKGLGLDVDQRVQIQNAVAGREVVFLK